MRVWAGSAILAAGLIVGCGGSSGGGASTSDAGAKPASGAAEFGVPECDEYIKKYTACIDSKVPDSAKAMMRQQLDQSKSAWKQAASTADGKAALASGCKQASDAAKAAMQAYGCTW
jgi:hypothetical protein